LGQPFTQPDFTSQNETALKTNYDNAAAVMARIAAMFNPEAQATPDLTVHLDAGAIWDAETLTLTEVAAQNSGAITAPTTNPRIDRAVIGLVTGTLSIITGAEAPSPVPPAITADKLPVAQIALVVSQTSIVNADITDERQLNFLGLGEMARNDVLALTTEASPDADNDFIPFWDTSAGAIRKATPTNISPSFPAGTSMLFQQTAAPTGWTKQTTHNNKAIRLQTGVVTTGGGDAFTTVFGAGKVTASHTLSTGQIPAHAHSERTSSGTGAGNNAVGGLDAGTASITSVTDTETDGGSGGGHAHNLSNLDLQFVDFIIANKD